MTRSIKFVIGSAAIMALSAYGSGAFVPTAVAQRPQAAAGIVGKGVPKSFADLVNFIEAPADPAIVNLMLQHKDGKGWDKAPMTPAQFDSLMARVSKARMEKIGAQAMDTGESPFVLDAGANLVVVVYRKPGLEPIVGVFDKKTGEGLGLHDPGAVFNPARRQYNKILRAAGLNRKDDD